MFKIIPAKYNKLHCHTIQINRCCQLPLSCEFFTVHNIGDADRSGLGTPDSKSMYDRRDECKTGNNGTSSFFPRG